jgi:hypothetical protein
LEREGGLGEHDAQQPVVLGCQVTTGQGEHPLRTERFGDLRVVGGGGHGRAERRLNLPAAVVLAEHSCALDPKRGAELLD